MQVTVTGLDRLASLREALSRLPEKMEQRAIESLEANREVILSRGRDTIKTHAYDVYNPKEYERSGNLMRALSFLNQGKSIVVYISGDWLKNAPNAYKEKKKIKPFDYQWSVDKGFGWFWHDYPWSGPRPYSYFLRAEVASIVRMIATEAAIQAAREVTRGG